MKYRINSLSASYARLTRVQTFNRAPAARVSGSEKARTYVKPSQSKASETQNKSGIVPGNFALFAIELSDLPSLLDNLQEVRNALSIANERTNLIQLGLKPRRSRSVVALRRGAGVGTSALLFMYQPGGGGSNRLRRKGTQSQSNVAGGVWCPGVRSWNLSKFTARKLCLSDRA